MEHQLVIYVFQSPINSFYSKSLQQKKKETNKKKHKQNPQKTENQPNKKNITH